VIKSEREYDIDEDGNAHEEKKIIRHPVQLLLEWKALRQVT
jgi:hypothetical protein